MLLNLVFVSYVFGQETTDYKKLRQEKRREIINKYFIEAEKKYGYFSSELQEELDKGLALDSTIAFLWQKKSEPLNKLGKYEIGMAYLDKAVKYDTLHWLAYRGFMNCIFAHRYHDAIRDFELAIKKYGNNIEMDHTYQFHIALSYLQLNEFRKAEKLFKQDIESYRKKYGNDSVHHLDLFYLGISQYEQKKYEEAIITFDLTLKKYPQFSEVLLYKSNCLKKLDKSEEATSLKVEAIKYGKMGYTINEDNVIHVRYPYQINWENF